MSVVVSIVPQVTEWWKKLTANNSKTPSASSMPVQCHFYANKTSDKGDILVVNQWF